MKKGILIGIGGVVAIVGFLLFRPDTLITDVQADESLEEAFAPSTTTATSPPEASNAQSSTTTAAGPNQTTQPVVVTVASGSFTGIDHAAIGSVAVYESDGRFVLRFEDDTDIQNGPDLYVWLLEAETYEGGSPTEYLDLGTLKGNVGGQNYDLPADFDPSVHRTVLIWCLRFAVPFAAAPLT
jgi:hypothetical protein